MNILYISNLSANIASGLNWSVPATVMAQAHIDNVYWLNLTNVIMPHWQEVDAFHNVNEFDDKLSIDNLPFPFNHPDIVIFEGFYHPKNPKLAKALVKKNIPYIISPRGSLTKQAQRMSWRKRLKKIIANVLIFKPYAKKAIALHFLTLAEQQDSGLFWNKQSFIVPNGFSTPSIYKLKFSENGVKAVFIGRLDLYHKGLDELLKACLYKAEYLRDNNFQLVIYGPQRYDYKKIRSFIENNALSDIIHLKGEISGIEKEQVLLDADLFILTSRFEGHPMGLIEAIAYGMPCLVSPGSNMSEEIEFRNAGWVCSTDVEAISNALVDIISNKHLLVEKGRAARQLSLSYNWIAIANKFHSIIINLLKSEK